MTSIDAALPAMQALASRLWTPRARHHPGQLAWSARYALPEDLGHGPVALATDGDGDVVAWAWAEAPDWVEVCLDPAHPDVLAPLLDELDTGARPLRTMVLETEDVLLGLLQEAGFAVEDGPWFTHHLLDLAALAPEPSPTGYTVRHVRADEAEERSACHRAAWAPPGGTSRVSAAAYRRLMGTAPYRRDLDLVAVHETGELAASALVWLDATTGVALVEPVGCVPGHRGRGLAGAVSRAALLAAREAGATSGLVCPRGDDDYPGPRRIYQGLGFVPGARTLTLVAVQP